VAFLRVASLAIVLALVAAAASMEMAVEAHPDLAAAVRGTTDDRGVSCFVAIDASTADRIDDPVALDRCVAGTG